MIDATTLCGRLFTQLGLTVLPDLIETDRPELTPDHEAQLVLDYGPNALVRYYSPKDPELPENVRVEAQA